MHTTKYPLSCLVMELAAQLEKQSLWLDLHWTPRELTTKADQLTNCDFSGFGEQARVSRDFAAVPVLVLEELLQAGAELEEHVAMARRERLRRALPGSGAKRQRREDALRNRDPW